jgi:hypothetical protein
MILYIAVAAAQRVFPDKHGSRMMLNFQCDCNRSTTWLRVCCLIRSGLVACNMQISQHVWRLHALSGRDVLELDCDAAENGFC